MKVLNCEFGYQESIIKSNGFELSKGKAYPLIGLNGAGKSTFLKTLIGQIKLRSGKIEVEGKSFHKLNNHDRS